MEYDVIKTLITVLIAGLGWAATHYFNSRRDHAIKRKEIVTAHLINAFRVLTHDISEREMTTERRIKLENIIADIQLFGSVEQVDLAKKLTDDAVAGTKFPLDKLINNLKHDLRSQLGLQQVQGNVRWLRLGTDLKQNDDLGNLE